MAFALVVVFMCTGCFRHAARPTTVNGETPAPTDARGTPSDDKSQVQGEGSGAAADAAAPLLSPVVNEEEKFAGLAPGELTASERPAPSTPLPFQTMSYGSQPLRSNAVARRHGGLSPSACSKELRKWTGTFKRVGAHKGIATPTRVVGTVEGVKFRVPGEKSKFGVLDCRLALTLVEFARFLQKRQVAEVVVDNFYRLNARLPSSRSKRSQHAYGLAIDLRSFRLADGRVWDVEKDWGASIDTEACGPDATLDSPTENTEGLRTLVCELFAEQIFSHHLTPSHDAAHRNHLHLDIKRDAKSAVIR